MNRSVTHTGTLRVDAVPEHAFQLFTAPGEKLWQQTHWTRSIHSISRTGSHPFLQVHRRSTASWNWRCHRPLSPYSN